MLFNRRKYTHLSKFILLLLRIDDKCKSSCRRIYQSSSSHAINIFMVLVPTSR
jgi:hypothetical protein